MEKIENIMIQGVEKMGIDLSKKAVDLFCIYSGYLEEKNDIMNLTAISGVKDVAELHFLDSLALLKLTDFQASKIIDIGSGAGFPGIPLKIAEPSINLTLLDAQKKRVQFLQQLCLKLDVSDVNCIHSRAEDEAHKEQYRERFDMAVSRAVAKLNVLCELCLPFVAVGGSFIAMKSTSCDEEIAEASRAIKVLGGQIEKIYDYEIAYSGIIHRAILIRKNQQSPGAYPRRFAKIQKNPLSE